MINNVSSRYIVLVLSLGKFDPDYVDAFYGPTAFKDEAERKNFTIKQILVEAQGALALLGPLPPGISLPALRFHYLHRQLRALIARTEMLLGRRFSFDEESLALYDAVAPTLPEVHFKNLLTELNSILPGTGPVPERLEIFRKDFLVPLDRLDGVFNAAVVESRRRTMKHIPLPADERFVIEYVTGKSWSGYNWFRGKGSSLIQINTEFPISIDRAVDLGSHEGYPGHHVYNSLLESALVRKLGWMEFSVYPLFSPQSLIAEGTANYGITLAFPGIERIEFEREVLFPLAGLDPSRTEEYYRVYELTQKLSYAGNEAARRYLNEECSREAAVEWLINYALMSPPRAEQRTKFFDQYRSYVINYNLGQDLVKEYIESRSTSPDDRWKEFSMLLCSPRLPSSLIAHH